MKKAKEVVMVCPKCGASFDKEPIIMIEKTGNTHLEYYRPKQCKYCRTGLVRRVEKHGVDKGPRAAS